MPEIVTCPVELLIHKKDPGLVTFLAGGISNCPDWQNDIINLYKQLSLASHRTLVNPRRVDFDINDPNMTQDQIHWEYRHINRCNSIIFWFPKETVCPITLFELGSALHTHTNISVGCHPEYSRKEDLLYQLRLRRSDIRLVYSIEELAVMSLSHIV